MDGAAKRAPMIGVVTGIVITDRGTVITSRAGVTIDPVHVRDDHERGDGIASAEPAADGNADTDEDGDGSIVVTARGSTTVAITIAITNRAGRRSRGRGQGGGHPMAFSFRT